MMNKHIERIIEKIQKKSNEVEDSASNEWDKGLSGDFKLLLLL